MAAMRMRLPLLHGIFVLMLVVFAAGLSLAGCGDDDEPGGGGGGATGGSGGSAGGGGGEGGSGVQPLEIVSTRLPASFLDKPYSTEIAATGGTQAGYSWSLSGGSLPAGVELAQEGSPATVLAGTPTAGGLFSFTVQVTDSGGNVTERPLWLGVHGPWVAYGASPDADPSRALYAIDVSGGTPGSPIELSGAIADGGEIQTIQWAPDGSSIVYEADQDTAGVDELYFVSMSGPTPAPPIKISADPAVTGEIFLFRWLASGAGIIYKTRPNSQIYYVDLRPDPPAAPVLLHPAFAEDVVWRDLLAPDGSKIVFCTGDNTVGGSRDLWMVDLTTSPPPPAEPFQLGGEDNFFSPDSNTLIVSYAGMTLRYDVSGSAPSTPTADDILLSGGDEAEFVEWAPDSSGIAYVLGDAVYWMDLSGTQAGSPVLLSGSLPEAGRMRFASDGRWLAMVGLVDTTWQQFALPIQNGVPQQPVQITDGTAGGEVTFNDRFTPDGARLLLMGDFATAGVAELYVSDLSGSTPTPATQLSAPLAAGQFVYSYYVAAVSSGLVYWVDGPAASQLWWAELDDDSAAPAMLHDAVLSKSWRGLRADRSELFFVAEGDGGGSDLFRVDLSGEAPGAPEQLVGDVGWAAVQPL